MADFAANRSRDIEARTRQIEDQLIEISAALAALQSAIATNTSGGGAAATAAAAGVGGGSGGGGALAGDVTGLPGSNEVVAIHHKAVDTPVSPTDDQKVLQYDDATGTIRWTSLVSDQNSVTWDGVTYPVLLARISASVSGPTAVVAAVPGKRITVLAWNYVVAGAVEVEWLSNVTSILGPQAYSATGGNEASRAPHGYLMRTAVGEALNVSLSASVMAEGVLNYIEEIP